ncbi:MAG: hypothetical protein F9K48_10255 [Candidatus Brocadia sp.]|nr:MAG: hypothetical protein F9K48_10255 [Candidatus Brocadia sp.]
MKPNKIGEIGAVGFRFDETQPTLLKFFSPRSLRRLLKNRFHKSLCLGLRREVKDNEVLF